MKSERTDIPKRATKFSAGYDFYSPDNYHLEPGVWTEIDTEVSFDGSEVVASSGPSVTRWVMLVTPRSILGSIVPLDIKTCYHFCFSCANCGFQMKIDLRRVSASNDAGEVKE